ncbi:flagellin FliC [Candidatus Poribacteria bacterium]|nr:flagellin FliC [Candidatus Poribacteria bacterium]
MFRINQNITSINARRHLGITEVDARKTMERLSSGLRIVRAADDAAGLFVSEQMRAQIAGLKQANRNIQQAIALFQTADGGMEQLNSMMARLKELAVAAADSTFNTSNRAAIAKEVDALLTEIDRITQSTVFNGITLLTGPKFTFQVGDTAGNISRITISIGPVGTASIVPGVTSQDWVSQTSAALVIASLELGIASLSSVRTEVGAAQNRMERALANVQMQIENHSNSESIIRDADFAMETAALTRAQILVQAGTSVLNQANLLPQNAITLLQQF